MATDWRQVWALYAAGVAAACQFGKVAAMAGPVAADLGLSDQGIGWAMSLVNLLGVAFGASAGAWTERAGGRRVLLGGLALTCLAGAAGAAAPDAGMLLAARTAEGLGFLVVIVAAPTLIALAAAPGDRPLALSLWGTFIPVGFGLVAVMSGLLAGTLGWRGLFALNAALPAAAALAVLLFVPPVPRRPAEGGGLAVLRARGPVLLALGFGCFTLGFQAFLGFLPIRLVEDRGLDLAQAGLAAGLAAAASAAGTLLAGAAMKRGAGAAAVAAAGFALPAFAAFAVYGPGPAGGAVAGAFAFMAFAGFIPAAVFSGLPRVAPSMIGPANGLVVQTGNLGSLVGPPATAAFAGLAGWAAVPWMLGAVAAAGTACLVLAFSARPGQPGARESRPGEPEAGPRSERTKSARSRQGPRSQNALARPDGEGTTQSTVPDGASGWRP
jgi:predicted MFS family arabinose efflux permease